MPDRAFDLDLFLPYVLNQAAEATSAAFQATYRGDYGMTRTQWRILAHLGKRGPMTAAQICRITFTDKTKVSRAVQALEASGLLQRAGIAGDRRSERLTLTRAGQTAYETLGRKALTFDQSLRQALGPQAAAALDTVLHRLIALSTHPEKEP